MSEILNTTHLTGRDIDQVLNLVKGESVLARLSGQIPMQFRGADIATVSLDNEADIVAEGGAKAVGGASIAHKPIRPVKFEYGTRFSDEFLLSVTGSVIQAYIEGMGRKFARALDIAAIHGLNPRTGTASTEIGTNYFINQVTNVVTATTDIYKDMNTAITLLQTSDMEVSGAAFSPAALNALANKNDTTGQPLFPETGWGLNVTSIKGLSVASASTVSFNSSGVSAIAGDFNNGFRYGIAAKIPVEFIRYGNPDNAVNADGSPRDLRGYNETYIRAEIFYGWAILMPDSFVVISAGA